MTIQSLSICVPAKKCINDCKFCCSKIHDVGYVDRFCTYIKYSEVDIRLKS